MSTPTALFHYTCGHGAAGIGVDGVVKPSRLLIPPERLAAEGVPDVFRFAWFTDLDAPFHEPLGLTNRMLRCRRTEVRFRVLDAALVVPWRSVRRSVPAGWRDGLELAGGAMPAHWWVSEEPVPVVLDPVGAS